MKLDVDAAFKSTLVVLVGAVLCFIPPTAVLILIAVMLPLWVLHGAGVPGLGRELNGFFVPSAVGWSLVSVFVWCGCYAILRFKARLKRDAASGG